ncbi:MAG: ABC transporter permease, partial [Planctomycetaceae bacterium]
DMGLLNAAALLLFLCLIAFGLSALGFMIAWRLDSVQGFHAIMSVVLMPMWLVSGAMFPGEDSVVLSWIIRLNPLSYGVAGVRRLLDGNISAVDVAGVSSGQVQGLPEMTTCVVVIAVFSVCCFQMAVHQVRRVH